MNYIKHISAHAKDERLQQRGIPKALLPLIDRYGERFRCNKDQHHSHDSANYLYFSQKSIEKMKFQGISMKLVQLVEKKCHLRFVVSEDGVLITAKYANKDNRRVHH